MAYHRQFTDAAGVEWTVYDIVPRPEERREADRRDASQVALADGERRTDDRRAAIATRTSRPVRLTRAWLCFESATERRRLQPVPENWHLRTDAELSELRDRARVAPRRNRAGQGAGARQR